MKRGYACWWCGERFTTVHDHLVHVSGCTAPGDRTITRAVHCWACAGPIDLRAGRTCPTCGLVYKTGRIT